MGVLNQIMALKKTILFVIVFAVLLFIIAKVFVSFNMGQEKEKDIQVITASTLKKIINVSKLSTYTAVYNGIAEVKSKDNSEKTDYYVAYEARVNAGIDFDQITCTVDDAAQVVKIDIPDVHITDINVNISSLDFIFFNKNANKSTVTSEAQKVCEADVQEESKKQDEILRLAQQNAVNVIKALVNPIMEQLDADYTLVVE